MFNNIQKHLTLRNVLIGTAVVGAVGGLIYLVVKDDAAPAAESLSEAGESLVEAGSSLVAEAASSVADAAEQVA